MSDSSFVPLILGLALGVVVGALLVRARAARQIGELTSELTAERSLAADRLALIGADSSRSTGIESLVSPVTDSLNALANRVEAAERARLTSTAALSEQVQAMAAANQQLRDETGRLAHALSRSEFRGRWGESQLRRVVEAAGLTSGVDFVEQATIITADSTLRPDMVVTLSDNRKIVVDAKVALDALLTPDLDPKTMVARHGEAVATHIDQLSAKQYWRQFDRTPEFVVMFLPAESILGTALQADPTLLERAFSRNIVLATPSTLLALLRTVALGWRDASLTENANEIYRLGKDLHARLQVFSGHLGKVGVALDTAVGSYNRAVGSLEGRVLVSARRMADLKVTTETIVPVVPIDRRARAVAGVALGSSQTTDVPLKL